MSAAHARSLALILVALPLLSSFGASGCHRVTPPHPVLTAASRRLCHRPSASHLTAMSRRSRRRKRGAAAADRAAELDVVRSGGATVGGAATNEATPAQRQPFPYLAVFDVEATCEDNSKHYIHEIIEFPVVLVDLAGDGGIVAEFHSYVRPTVNTTLSDFCTRLTGITQEQVDSAPTLPEVLEQFEEWRLAQGLVYNEERKDFVFGADGPWDLRFFVHGETARKGIAKSAYFDKWCNLKQLFADFYKVRTCKIHKMLQLQGMRFEGRLHSGIDDTRNIARIAMKMRQDGAVFYVNEALPPRFQHDGQFASGS